MDSAPASRSTSANDVLVLFPGALGDLICFLPALAGLVRRHPDGLTFVVNPEWQTLLQLPNTTMVSIDRAEIADLFTKGAVLRESTRSLLGGRGHAYSWTGSGDPAFAERLAALGAGPVRIFPFRGMAAREHATAYYARCAGIDPAPFRPFLRLDTDWFDRFVQRHDLGGRRLLVIHPGSGSAAKNWSGFSHLAERWQRRAGAGGQLILLYGPAEPAPKRPQPVPGALSLSDLTLPQVAALLRSCDLYAGNDSGISHLAGAVGARGVVVFGSTDPAIWSPRGGGLSIVHASTACEICEPNCFCTHRLSVESVERELDACRRQGAGGFTAG